MGSLSIWHWLIVLLVVVLIFGTKKLRNIGGDVGGAVKSFKDAMTEEKNAPDTTTANAANNKPAESLVIESKTVAAPVAKVPAKKRVAVAKNPATKPAAKKTTTSKSAADKPKVPAKKTSTAKPKAEA